MSATPSLLVIGANGKIGSATVRASLKRSIPTIAFLRTPSKLPSDLSSPNPHLKIVQGDAKNRQSILSAIRNDDSPVSCIVIAAPYGDMRGRRSGYEEINENILRAVMEVQRESGRKVRVWIMAGSAVLEHPEYKGRYLNSFMPTTFYPEYPHTIEFLEKECGELNWTMNCPALIKEGAPVGPLIESISTLPDYRPPFGLTRYLPFELGLAGNIMYNWVTQNITFQSLGEYMVDNMSLDERLKGKRVGVLELTNATM